MGGRGSASGMSDEGKRYGTEYKAIAQFGNVKVVKYNGENGKTQAKTPKEAMTPGRIYATVDKFYDIKNITFYDAEGERCGGTTIPNNRRTPGATPGDLPERYHIRNDVVSLFLLSGRK